MNPFVYGEEVGGDNFCNRKSEINELLRDIKNGQNVMLYSPRRYGKTSLVKEALRRAKTQGIFTVYIDLYPALSEEDFVRLSVKSITEQLRGSVTGILKKVRDLFKNLSPKMSVDIGDSGMPSFQVTLDRKDVLPAIEDVFGGLCKSIKSKGKRGVVVFDEFQQIAVFKTDRLEKELRTQIQSHREISYIFMGSKKHLIYDIFNNPNRPFYKSTKHFPLEKISEEHLVSFIHNKFFALKKVIKTDIIREILKITENHPYYTQFLCHVLCEMVERKKNVPLSEVHASIDVVLKREEAAFDNIWMVLTVKQKQVLIALAKANEDDKLFSTDFLGTHNIGSASTMQKALSNLVDRDLVDRDGNNYSILDIFFKLWILKKF